MSATLDRELPPAVAAKTKLHVLDTIAAMVSGSRLKAGEFAARYVDGLGGKPQAMVIGTSILTSSVNAALANGMAAHGDETDDSHLAARFHPGCGIVPAALATAELAGRSGNDVLRAVALGYDIGARAIFALGFRALYTERHSTHTLATTFGATAAAAAMLRLDPRQVRHAFSFAAQQASGVPYWERDREHIEKAFDFGGMGARNGVTAATMIAAGFTGVDDFMSGNKNMYTALGDENAAPEKLAADLGTRFEVINTSIKKWCVGSPLQSVLDAVTALLEDPAVRAGQVRRIVVDMPADRLHIVDNRTIPDICLQHLVALMIADGGATFDSVHDIARMSDPQGARHPQAGRGGAEPGTGEGDAGAPGDREDRHHGRPHTEPPYLRGARHPRQSHERRRGRRQGPRPDGARSRQGEGAGTQRGDRRSRPVRAGARPAPAGAGVAAAATRITPAARASLHVLEHPFVHHVGDVEVVFLEHHHVPVAVDALCPQAACNSIFDAGLLEIFRGAMVVELAW